MLLSHRTWQHSVDRVRRFLGGVPPRTQVAALPWREKEERLEIMLITSRDTGRWVLPKGWPEGEEEFHQAALREAAEEAGLRGTISTTDAGRYFYGKCLKSGLERRCEVYVFPLKVERVENKWPEKGQRIRRWFRPDEASAKVREPDLAELLAEFRGSI